ncbi:hypothetical protein [uncultured Mediterranean phage]|nr:hypothetical protein [uncultured Mediterranean phage]
MAKRKFRNTSRENRLEELGRVDAEKAYTRKGKRNLKEEKSRIRKELATGGRQARGPMDPKQQPQKRKQKDGLIFYDINTGKFSKYSGEMKKGGRGGPRMGKGKPKSGPRAGRPPAGYGPSPTEKFLDQYKKHKRDKFIKDLKKAKPEPRKPGDPPRIKNPKLPRPKRDRVMTPLRTKKRSGGLSQAQQHYLQHGYGPHKTKSSGKVIKGKKIGIQIK